MLTCVVLLAVALAFVAGILVARRRLFERALGRLRAAARLDAAPEASVALVTAPEPAPAALRFDPVVPRGTESAIFEDHAPAWREAMAGAGEQFFEAGVSGVVFVHGTFTGTDPLSAYGAIERALPSGLGSVVARTLRKKTRGYLERVLGDLGNFGASYVRLFETALGVRIPCTDYVWSSENHHVGRLAGALGLVRVLATHAELAEDLHRERRLLVIGHSHAGQLFALVTQLLARSMASEAILDVARSRGIDVVALEADLQILATCGVDFVTFGAPARYAWATVARVRALHVLDAESDLICRLAVPGSDFPAFGAEDRRLNQVLGDTLGPGFAPSRVAAALRSELGLPPNGEVMLIAYGEKTLGSVVTNGFGHGVYTRLDAMLFHARLIAERLYPSARGREADTGAA